jgi:hypothetical protein
MTSEIKIKRGTKAQLPSLGLAEPGFTTDTKELYIGDGVGNVKIGSDSLSELSDTPSDYTGSAGKALVVNQTEDGVEFSTISGTSSDYGVLSVLQIRNTSTLILETTWTDISFDTVDISVGSDTIEADSSNSDRVLIKSSGIYSFSVNTTVTTTNQTKSVYYRLRVNDVTVVDSSLFNVRLYPNETHEISREVLVNLTAGDYVSLQMYVDSTYGSTTVEANHMLSVRSLNALKGDQGEPGPSGALTIEDSAYFDAYDSAGSLALTTSWQDVPFDVVRKNSGEFTVTSNTTLTIPQTTVYNVNARVTVEIISGTSRSDAMIRLVKDSGGGFVEVPGSLAFTYNRTYNYGTGTANINLLDDFNAGDRIKVQVAKHNGNSTLATLADGSSLSVFIPGGVPGQDGQDGSPGAGSTVIIKDNGVAVANTPHSTINFAGAGWDVSDEGNGQVEVDFSYTNTFGTYYAWDESDNQSVTTSSNYQNKLTLSVEDVPAGYYRISWYYEWRINSNSREFMARLRWNDSDNLMEMIQESSDADNWFTEQGFAIRQLTAGDHYFDLDYAVSNNGTSVYIRRSRMEFWRVA